MTWGGDVARMIGGLLFNERALGEAYTVSTAEHHTWGEIAEFYREICGLNSVWVDKELFQELYNHQLYKNVPPYWQLECDRLFDRVIDNGKVLAATGLKQSELKPLYEGLEAEIARCPRNYPWKVRTRFDEYLATQGIQ